MKGVSHQQQLAIQPVPSSSQPPAAVVVDALPYIDNEYEEEGMKEMLGQLPCSASYDMNIPFLNWCKWCYWLNSEIRAGKLALESYIVMSMIEDEKRRYRPTKNYLEHLPPIQLHRFETPLLHREFERLLQRLPMEVLSMKRYELPPPPAGKLTDLTAWNECLDNSYAQLEHQAVRISNLELMQEYGSEGWKSYLEIVSRISRESGKQLAGIKRSLQDLNYSRKSTQLAAGEQLRRLESSWVGLISKNYEIEQACLHLESVKYEKGAEKAQLEFILSDEGGARGGARKRRRLRRRVWERVTEGSQQQVELQAAADATEKESQPEALEPNAIQLQPETEPSVEVEASSKDSTVDTVAMETEPIDAEAVKTDAVEKEAVEKEAVEREAVEKEAVETEAVETEAVETEAVETEAVEAETEAMETANE